MSNEPGPGARPPEHDIDDEELESVAAPDAEEARSGRRRRRKLPSAVTGRKYRKRELVNIDHLRPALTERIRRDHPDLPQDARISLGELSRYRMLYLEELLQQEHGEFTELDREVAESIARHDTIAENTEVEYEEQRSFGERLSDHLASFGGSWSFLIAFGIVLVVWMAINVWRGDKEAFDPYPFILLNLVLSCLAAIQAPIIMMSQRRQEEKDRQRSFNDYRVNLKAELEIRHLHEKIDYLISRQWQRLSEIQQLQIEMLQEAGGRKKAKAPKTGGANGETASSPAADANDSD